MSSGSAERILVVEDEKNVGSTLVERLKKEGYEVSWATSVSESRLEVSQRKFDLCLLDIGLPDGDGFEVAELVRQTAPGTSIMFLTAQGSPDYRVRGLELGAEDYVVKPFHLKELLLRIKNALRRGKHLKEVTGPVTVGKAEVDFSRYEARVDGKVQSLTQKECALLKLLVDRRGSVVSRDEILNHVWSEEEFPTPRTVDNFIMRLRRLVEEDAENPQIIRSVRGVGYQLV